MRTWLAVSILLAVGCSSGAAREGPDASIADAPMSATCGACPTDRPLCYEIESSDGAYIVSAVCTAVPSACAATPTCACAVDAYVPPSPGGETEDAGGFPACPGNGPLYCLGREGPLTITCDPP